jgi:hypothetical protein
MLDWKAAKFHTFKLSLLGKKVIKLSYDSLFLDITCTLTLTMLDWKAAKFHTFKLSLLGKKVIKLSYDSLFLDITCTLTLHYRPSQSMYGTRAHLSFAHGWGPLYRSTSLYFNVPNINRSSLNVLHINRTLLQPGKVDVQSVVVPFNALQINCSIHQLSVEV